jgi:hypothetical protein
MTLVIFKKLKDTDFNIEIKEYLQCSFRSIKSNQENRYRDEY